MMIAALRQRCITPSERRTRTTIEDVLYRALLTYVDAPDSEPVRDSLREALERYVDAEQVTR